MGNQTRTLSAETIVSAEVLARGGLSLGFGGEQRASIFVARIGEDIVGLARLDDPAPLHHHDIARDLAHDAEIMGDEQHRHAELGLQLLQQLQDLRLHSDVERGGRLVGDEEIGAAGERHRDHHALALPARELVRIRAEFSSRDRRRRLR